MCHSIGPMNEDGSNPDSPFVKHLNDAEKLLTKYELKLIEYNDTRGSPDIMQISEVALADEAWHSKMKDGEFKAEAERVHRHSRHTRLVQLSEVALAVGEWPSKMTDGEFKAEVEA